MVRLYLLPLAVQVTLANHAHGRGLAMTEEGLAAMCEAGLKMPLPELLYLEGQALLGQGRQDKARAALLDARAEAQRMGYRRILWHTLAALTELEGDPTEAEGLRQQARDVIDYIAAHAGSEALRVSFLARPDVQAMVGEKV